MTTETHALVASRLMVYGFIADVMGGKPSDPLTPGRPLTADERAKLMQDPTAQLSAQGVTFFYPVGKDGVFFDSSFGQTMAWFNGGDAASAVDTFERTLLEAYPHARRLEDRDHPGNPDLLARFHRVDLDSRISVLFESNYPKPGSRAQQFAVRGLILRKAAPPGEMQAAEPITQASLTAFLAANNVVPTIRGTLSMRTPAPGKILTPEQRQQLGLAPEGVAYVYELIGGDVFMDMAGNTATISFAKGDVDTAMSTFDRLLKRDAPQFRQLEDVRHPRGGKRKLRVYEARFDGGIVCRIEADYPERGAAPEHNRFVVRVAAFINPS